VVVAYPSRLLPRIPRPGGVSTVVHISLKPLFPFSSPSLVNYYLRNYVEKVGLLEYLLHDIFALERVLLPF
jgi:hypothetical protein